MTKIRQNKYIVEYVSSVVVVRSDVRTGKWREKYQKLVIETLPKSADDKADKVHV